MTPVPAADTAWGKADFERLHLSPISEPYCICALNQYAVSGSYSVNQLEAFDWDPFAASPNRLPIYITRNEFDPNNGKYGSTIPLETNWEIVETDTWEDTYADATPEMRRAADDACDKLRKNVFHPGLNFEECRPDDRYYFRLNLEFRGIARVDNESERIDLIDFGEHDIPAEYGCYNT